jgi:hypothetical protein
MAGNIQIQIEASTDQLIKALNEADKAAVKTTAKISESFENVKASSTDASSSISNGFGGSWKTIAKGVAVGTLVAKGLEWAAKEIVGFLGDSIKAAQEQEDAINKLNQALRASGGYSAQAAEDFADFAAEMQRNSKYGDEVILGQLAVAKSFGATNKEARNLVLAAANLSATFGGSLEENVMKLGKTLDGSAGKLSKFIPELTGLTREQLKAAGAADLINEKFAGAAASELETYSGKVTSLKNAWSDLQEEIGGFITQSSIVQGTLGFFTTAFQKITQSIIDWKMANDRQKEGFVETENSVEALARRYAELTEAIEEQQAIIDANKDDKFSVRAQGAIKMARDELVGLNREYENVFKTISDFKPEEPAEDKNKKKGGVSEADQKLIDSRKAAYEELKLAQADYVVWQAEQDLAMATITEENEAMVLEKIRAAEQLKINAIYDAEMQKAALVKDSQAKQFAVAKAQLDRESALQKSNITTQQKVNQQKLAQERLFQDAKIGIMGGAFQLAAALAKDGSKEQFLIQKAAALAEIAIARGKAIALIPAQTAHIPYPGNIPAAAQLMAYANIQAALGAATVVASAIKGYEQGGIIGGSSYHGDSQLIRANSREMILNQQEQGEMFRQLKHGGGIGEDTLAVLVDAIRNMPIVVQANGREIARLVRDERANGFAV